MISVTFLEVDKNHMSSNWIDVRIPRKVTGARKRLFTTCENSSRKGGCSKTSTSNTWKTDRNIILISVTIQEIDKNLNNINGIEVRSPRKLTEDRKRLFNTCENSSQNLGCSKTSTSNT